MSGSLTTMAYGDVRLVSFLWGQWLLPNDSIEGTPTITVAEPIVSGTFVNTVGATVTVSVTAGNFTGTGQVSCSVVTTNGEKATRTAYIPVGPLVS